MFLESSLLLKENNISKATERRVVEAWDQAGDLAFWLSLVISMKVIPQSDRVLDRLKGWGGGKKKSWLVMNRLLIQDIIKIK